MPTVLLLATALASTPPPHLILLLADDAGWNDFGFTKGLVAGDDYAAGLPEAQTPALDALANDGIRLRRAYAYRYCSPSRASLLTGRIPAHVHEINPGLATPGCTNLNYTMLPELLKRIAGYRSYWVGKWHQGLESQVCVPYGRGFRAGSFGFLGGEEDHVDQTTATATCGCTDKDGGCVDLWRGQQPALGENGTYNGYTFTREAVQLIEAHPPNVPMFLYTAWQAVHGPYEVPDRFRRLFPDDESCPPSPTPSHSPDCCGWTERSSASPCDVASVEGVCKCPSDVMPFQPPTLRCPPGAQCTRLYMLAMLAALDESVANVTHALRRRGLYNNSVMVFASDNGGAVADCDRFDPGCQLGAMNNHPLRGGKYSYFEGGVRVASFVHSPLLPAAARGTVADGLVAIADFYATFARLASGGSSWEPLSWSSPSSSAREMSGTTPPQPWGCLEHSPCTFAVDGVNQWEHWASGGAHADAPPAPRKELLLGTRDGSALLHGRLKLVLGRQQPDWWYGPFSPNCTDGTGTHPAPTNCGDGCLFDIEQDPGEHVNLRLARARDFDRLRARLHELAPWVNRSDRSGGHAKDDDQVGGAQAEGQGAGQSESRHHVRAHTMARTEEDSSHESSKLCDAMRTRWGGHFGPWE